MESTRHSASAAERLRRQRIFGSSIVEIGVFRAPAGSALYGPQRPPGHFAVAFPETAVRIRPAGGPAFVTDRNVVTLYEPDDLYERGLVDARGDYCTFIAPSAELAREFAESARLARGDRRLFGRPFELCSVSTFRRQRRLVRRLARRQPAPTAMVEEEALLVLHGVAATAAARARSRLGPARRQARRYARRAREYLACTYASAPALQDVAAAVGCSPYYLSRVFRSHFGTTLHRYRSDLALRDAYDQICGTDRRLLDIALDLGFASHSHMTTAFRGRFGDLPSSLRAGR